MEMCCFDEISRIIQRYPNQYFWERASQDKIMRTAHSQSKELLAEA